jgi:hypothetical protein
LSLDFSNQVAASAFQASDPANRIAAVTLSVTTSLRIGILLRLQSGLGKFLREKRRGQVPWSRAVIAKQKKGRHSKQSREEFHVGDVTVAGFSQSAGHAAASPRPADPVPAGTAPPAAESEAVGFPNRCEGLGADMPC